MTFQVSPSVVVNEIDLTTQPQFASVSTAGFVGRYRWGPVGERSTISDESKLARDFYKPDGTTFVDFMTAASYLSYSDKLINVRVVDEEVALNSSTNVSPAEGFLIRNRDHYDQIASSLSHSEFIAKYPGALGDTLAVALCPGTDAFYTILPGTFEIDTDTNAKLVTYTPDGAEELTEYYNVGDYFVINNRRYKVASVTSTTLTLTRNFVGTNFVSAIAAREWEFGPIFQGAPGADEFHLVVKDVDGSWSGVPGTVLESYSFLSTNPTAKYEDGTAAYYVKVLSRSSKYVYFGGVSLPLSSTDLINYNYSFTGGVDGNDTVTDAQLITAYDLFRNAEKADVAMLIMGSHSTVVGNHVIQNIAEYRKDLVVFVSPLLSDVVNNPGEEVVSSVTTRGEYPSTSYAVMDNNWKYMYDRYNDEYRWIPCNGDSAGLCTRTDSEFDPWFSPAGFTRGGIKNAIKLAYDADKTDRDELYRNGINSYVDFPDQGKVLFGDKTLLARPSAFDRINVRRLFIVLEKSIATFAKFSLFELNDEFTRAQFVGKVEPFLRTVKGRRGVTDFAVVCDERNNTGDVIDRNEFIGDIYIKPARSINFITLNFVATPTGIDFSELIQAA